MVLVKPRVTVTLEPYQAETLRRVSRVNGVSISSIIRDFVEAWEPGLRRIADLGEAMEQADAAQRAELAAALQRVDEELALPLQEALQTSTAALEAIDAVAGVAQVDPPSSNQGGQVLQLKGGKASKKSRKA